jgi:hypothetical protein
VAVVLLGLAGYLSSTTEHTEAKRPQQAGQPVNPYAVAGHIARARVAALVGDSRGAEAHVTAIAHDLARSTRIPDVTRLIDHEAARAAVRPLSGVRSAVWLDAANFVVMVDGAQHRNMDMINQVCFALEPLGDTLAVVVNLQDVTAKEPDGAMTLSRNCQLPEGRRAFLQSKRQVDAVESTSRENFGSSQKN